jgi:hypothetical protein
LGQSPDGHAAVFGHDGGIGCLQLLAHLGDDRFFLGTDACRSHFTSLDIDGFGALAMRTPEIPAIAAQEFCVRLWLPQGPPLLVGIH